MNLTHVNKSGSCEPLGDFVHLRYDYKCMFQLLYTVG